MRPLNVDWQRHSDRSALLFCLAVATLFWPAANLLCIGVFTLHSFFSKSFWPDFKKKDFILKWLLLAYFFLHLIGLFYSEDVAHGWAKINILLPLLLMPLSIGSLEVSGRFKITVLNVFVMAAVLAALLALGNAAFQSAVRGQFFKTVVDDGTAVKEYFFSYTRLSFFVMHPAYFSIYVGTAIFAGWHLFKTNTMWIKPRWARFSVLAFLVIFLILLQSRMQMLAFFGIISAYFIVPFFRRKKWRPILLFTGVCVAIFFILLKILPESATRRLTEIKSFDYQMDAPEIYQFNGLTLRLAEWKCAWQAIEKQPIIGYGTGDAQDALENSYAENNFVVGAHRHFNAHNQYLQIWLGTGIFGLLLLVGIFTCLAVLAWRKKDRLLAAATAFFFLGMITEAMLERIAGASFLGVFILFLSICTQKNSIEKTGR